MQYTGKESYAELLAIDPNYRFISNLGYSNYRVSLDGNVVEYPSGIKPYYDSVANNWRLLDRLTRTRSCLHPEVLVGASWCREPVELWKNSKYAEFIRNFRDFDRIPRECKTKLAYLDRGGRNYWLTKYGDIFCVSRGLFLQGQVSPNTGYKHICLNGVQNISIHRLVAKYFVPIPRKFINMHLTASDLVVNHIDGNKLNNCADNLEWTTQKGNIKHAQINGLYPTNISNEVLEIIWQNLAAGKTDTEISKLVNIPAPTISNIRNRTCPRYDTPNYTWRKSSISDETIEKRYARDKALIADYNAGNNTAYLVDKYRIDSKTIYGILNRHPELVTRVRKKCSSRVKLNDQIVTEIYNLFVTTELNNYDIAKKYGCSPAAVLDIRRGRTFRRLGEQYRIEHGNWDGWLDTTM